MANTNTDPLHSRFLVSRSPPRSSSLVQPNSLFSLAENAPRVKLVKVEGGGERIQEIGTAVTYTPPNRAFARIEEPITLLRG